MSLKYVGKEHYISLITKHLNKELNTSELKELNNWLSASSNNANLVSELKQVWSTVGTYKAATSFDVDLAYKNFIKKYDIKPLSGASATEKTAIGGLSLLRAFFAALTAAVLIYGGIQLSNKLKYSKSNDGLTAMSIELSSLSTATLAPNTTLSFNKDDFNLSKLEGQVYLELDEKKGTSPLRLDLEDITANANNAILNIQKSKEDKSIIADIAQGSVTFQVNNEKVQLKEGQRLIYNSEDKTQQLTDSDSKAFAWKKGYLNFDNTPLTEVFSDIENFYGVNIIVSDDSPLSGHFTALNYRPSSLNECLELIGSSIEMTIVRSDSDPKNVYISDIKAK